MIDLVLKLAGSTIDLLVTKERNKYRDRYMKLKKEFYEEKNKANPDMAVLDNLEFDLFLLCSSISSEATKQALGNSSQSPSP
jgi:hypothetical protein